MRGKKNKKATQILTMEKKNIIIMYFYHIFLGIDYMSQRV